MEIQNYKADENDLLPFEFNKKLSIKDIGKKLRHITKSSYSFNKYMNKFYYNPMYLSSLPTEESLYTSTKLNSERAFPRLESQTSDFKDTKTKYFQTEVSVINSNQNYMEKKMKTMCETVSNNNIVKNAKIKNNFTTSLSSSKGRNMRKLILPQIGSYQIKENENNDTFYNGKLKTSRAVINNIIEIFYENGKSDSSNSSNLSNFIHKNIIYEQNRMKCENLEGKIVEMINQYINVNEFSADPNSNSMLLLQHQYQLQKVFNNNSPNEMELLLKSMSIELVDTKDTNVLTNNTLKCAIPFNFVLLLSLCTMDQTIELLSDILKFSSDFKSLTIFPEKIKKCLSKKEPFASMNKADGNNIIHLINANKLKEIQKFTWITQSTTYEVTLNLPTVELYFKRKNLQLNRTLDKDFLFFLIFSNFEKWDFYTINNLTLNKSFRNVFNKILSITDSSKYDFSHSILKKQINIDDKKPQIKTHTYDDKNFSFIYTNNITYTNFFMVIKGYSTECLNSLAEMTSNTSHFFTIAHSVKLFKIPKFWDLEVLLRSAYSINKSNNLLVYDSQFLDKFDDDFIKFCQKMKNHSTNTENVNISEGINSLLNSNSIRVKIR